MTSKVRGLADARRLLGRRLREERKRRQEAAPESLRHDYSQEGIAERLGVETPTVSRWESGQRVPDVWRLAELATTIGVPLAVLLSDIALVERSGSQRKGEGRVGAK